MKTVSVIFVSFIVLTTAGPDKEHWAYGHESEWPGECTTGKRQSPINILSRDATLDQFGAHIRGPLEFHGYEHVNVQAENNGHTAIWNSLDYPAGPVLSGGPLRGNYTLKQFHLHWLSEHAIDGIKYPVEIHFVHLKQGCSTDDALAMDDGVAVIAVMCELQTGPDSEQAMLEIMTDVPQVLMREAQPKNPHQIDITRLFSSDRQTYYTYHGSLTTPDCKEVVTWIVMDKPIGISDDQFKLITKVDVGSLNNARSLQPVNRVVYKVLGNPSANCALSLRSNTNPTTFLATLATLINCFSGNLGKSMKKSACALYNSKTKFFKRATLKECAKFGY